MTEFTIDGKKYVLLPKASYDELQKKSVLKVQPEKTFKVENARDYSKQLIHKWAKEK